MAFVMTKPGLAGAGEVFAQAAAITVARADAAISLRCMGDVTRYAGLRTGISNMGERMIRIERSPVVIPSVSAVVIPSVSEGSSFSR